MANARVERLAADLALYRRLVGSRLRSQMQYRGSFLILMAVGFLGLSMEFVAVLILFAHFGDLAGWEVGEVAFLYGLASISFGLAELVGAGFDIFPETIRRGEFDRVLLRPHSVFMQVISADFQLRRLGRVLQGIMALGLAVA